MIKCILISDIHYGLFTNQLADTSLRKAIQQAESLSVPLIIAGDLHDTKAILRAECVNMMLKTFKRAKCKIYLLIGNHDKLNEKGEEHSLEFLSPYCEIVNKIEFNHDLGMWLIPYQNDLLAFKNYLKSYIRPGETLIMHQGVKTAYMGHYIKDDTSLDKEVFANYRTISGHYHRRQDIKCGPVKKNNVGLFSYIGNPYTLNYAESTDPEKGIRLLNEDGSLDFFPLNLRKHVVFDINFSEIGNKTFSFSLEDIIKVKITGKRDQLHSLNKDDLSNKLGFIPSKLEFIYTDEDTIESTKSSYTKEEKFDMIIDKGVSSPIISRKYKDLWRSILNETPKSKSS